LGTNLKLPEIARTSTALGPSLGLSQRRQQQRGQNGDDGDDHQQFYESETQILPIAAKLVSAISHCERVLQLRLTFKPVSFSRTTPEMQDGVHPFDCSLFTQRDVR
jgi:hypothetical protein